MVKTRRIKVDPDSFRMIWKYVVGGKITSHTIQYGAFLFTTEEIVEIKKTTKKGVDQWR